MSLREADPITEVSKPHSSEIEHRPREVDPFVCDIGNGFQKTRRQIARADTKLKYMPCRQRPRLQLRNDEVEQLKSLRGRIKPRRPILGVAAIMKLMFGADDPFH